MNDEVRYKAAAAVVALASRTESAGKRDSSDAKAIKSAKGPAWKPMPYSKDQLMHEGKLREAVAYYEIADSINRDAAGLGYPRAMLLESMGAYDEAIAAYRSLAGTYYEHPGQMGEERCREKVHGSYNALTSGLPKELIDALANLDAATDFVDRSKQEKATFSGDDDERIRRDAAETALAFVNCLLDRDYSSARKLLHSRESSLTERDLRESFETMFQGEEFPESASVFDVQTAVPSMAPDEIAWVYVTIASENCEAVSLHVARDRDRLVVCNIEWGRP